MAAKFIVIFLILALGKDSDVYGMKLVKVLGFSRHNIRTPLTESLEKVTPRPWPLWKENVGELTSKGVLMEEYLGRYVSKWLVDKGLLNKGCPNPEDIHIYANTRQRTIATAKAFAEAAFSKCNVVVHHKNTIEMDPLFNPVIHNATEAFKIALTTEIKDKELKIDLKDAYEELNRILDIKNSHICKDNNICDLSRQKNEIVCEVGEEPNLIGPLFIGNSVVDAFIMNYYEGRPMNEVAWGELRTPEQWELVTKLTRENQYIRFNLSTGAKDIAGPLINYMKEILMSNNELPKFTLLVGHDSNLNPILRALDFESFELPEQYEPIPVGSKILFQKWNDGEQDFLRVEFVYLSWHQLRNGTKIDEKNPPMKLTLALKNCQIDKSGFCPWNQFIDLLKDF